MAKDMENPDDVRELEFVDGEPVATKEDEGGQENDDADD